MVPQMAQSLPHLRQRPAPRPERVVTNGELAGCSSHAGQTGDSRARGTPSAHWPAPPVGPQRRLMRHTATGREAPCVGAEMGCLSPGGLEQPPTQHTRNRTMEQDSDGRASVA